MSKSYWMKKQEGDFSNDQEDTFDPEKRYVGIRLQQGVPLLDRDWNEFEDIRRYEELMLRKWYVGNGTPDDGFKISAVGPPAKNDFKIAAGRCIVDGFEAVNEPCFSIDAAEFKDDLNNKGIISKKLKDIFENEGYPLSDNAKVTKEKEKENEWVIADEEEFIVRKEDGKLNIYADYIRYLQQDGVALNRPDTDRVDTVYLDVWIEERTSGKGKYDAPDNSQDVKVLTCIRHRIEWRVRVDEGSNGYDIEEYHHYYDLAKITRKAQPRINNISHFEPTRRPTTIRPARTRTNDISDDDIVDLRRTGLAVYHLKERIESLSNNSIADALHRHSKLVGRDGSPDPALSVDNAGNVGIGTPELKAKLEVTGEIKAPFFKVGQGNSTKVTAGKWYRIAENKVSGKRANAEFTLRDYISGGGHSTLTFRIGISYNDAPGMSFTVLNHNRYIKTTFTKIRVLEKTTYDNQYLEVYVNRKGSVDYSIYDNLQNGGWEPVDWEEITTLPDGYTAREFEVDKLFVVGDYENRFTVDRGGNVGIGIGTDDPGEKLEVGGNIKFTGDNLKTNAINRITPIYIRGTGKNNNAPRILRIGSTTVYSGSGRGLRLTILKKIDHSIESDKVYDTFGKPKDSDALETELNAMTKDQIGILISYDAWEHSVDVGLDAAFQRVGLIKAMSTPNSGWRRPYAAIFEPGSGEGQVSKAIEVLYNSGLEREEPYAEIRGWLIDGSFVGSGSAPSYLVNNLGNTTSVVVSESGNVGIGTPKPEAKLDVKGALNVSGAKKFLIDHPLDSEHKNLLHATLEGPEVAVFYRGEAQLSNGQVTIQLPDYFEALTRKENRTVLLTSKFEADAPISMLAVSEVKEGRFKVKMIDDKNPSQKFYWEVKAVRADVDILEVEETKTAASEGKST